jgi:hypothetical protein
MDSFWSTLVILALMALLSLPATVFIANTLFLDLSQFHGGSDPELSGRKDESVLKKPVVEKDIGKMKFDQPMVNLKPNLAKYSANTRIFSSCKYS